MGKLNRPLIASINAKLINPEYLEEKNELTFQFSSFKDNGVKCVINSPYGVKNINYSGKEIKDFESKKIKDSYYKISFSFIEEVNKNKVVISFK